MSNLKTKKNITGTKLHTIKSGGAWSDTLRRLRKNKLAIICLIAFVLICLACVFAPIVTKWSYFTINPGARISPPSLEHLFGTDNLGRDMFARVLYGGRVTLRIALISTIIALAVGSIIGLVAGYFGGKVDLIVSPLLDIFAAVPVILLAIVFESMIGWGQGNFMYAIAIAAMPQFARLVRASVMSIMGSEYIEAARALGVSHIGVISRHVAHNVAPQLIVRFTIALAEALLTCTIMGYLSIGINPPTPEWGNIVYQAKSYMRVAPQLMVIPCSVISLCVVSISVFGDGLRDAMDPRG